MSSTNWPGTGPSYAPPAEYAGTPARATPTPPSYDDAAVYSSTDAGAQAWRLSFAGLLRSELRKLTTLASTWVLLGLSLALGLYSTAQMNAAMLMLVQTLNDSGATVLPPPTAVSQMLVAAPFYPGAVMGLFGIMAVTNEFGSGMIRTTIALAPSRWPALTAKVVVVGAFAFVSAVVGEFIGALIAWPQMSGDAQFDLFTRLGLQVWLGGSLVVMLLALMGLAFGTLIRSTSGAVLTFLLGIMLILPFFALLVAAATNSDTVVRHVVTHVPAVAALFVYIGPFLESVGVPNPVMGTADALVTMLAWTAVPLAGAYAVWVRRDV
ncbi:MAG: ABC transporter permease [Actinomycetia bacterium]|nr:ABC transporter permease [Actinomycetes bacterium]